MSLSLPGVVVYTSVSFTAYDYFKHNLPSDKVSKEAWWYPFAKMGCGAAAGVAAQTCSYPLDTLRRRMQLAGAPGTLLAAGAGPAGGGAARRARATYAGLIGGMAGEQGGLARALFRGWGINCVKIVPGAAVQFLAYDALRVGVTWLDPTSGAQSPL
ncbi:substrate carrier [Monoraphidium neglectum]|uniref:Substrate carrier n=1 Tax=Monoraphidium neglectum TaxID=145388 RepID=A0A0D2MW44_9CHLO|nr:substrate carrier [Monoraphidium neglectum]KIY98530.1 substrate carrier [Monoraphidium neglectum]|eukprot:XP_013897550.1 substrate carrier [Monoraphidium neglectum]